ncbi:MAG: amino acid ABC transporter substrate-binding protein [Alphaproteobacteria bacterium]|nr:ABC transporter substrate-binding protein [Alphaproteobacteria bacterium]TAD91673.1 MAG: amino acid ABC transporter substrate-binding protein [Alphaproteobacteria bacterium]
MKAWVIALISAVWGVGLGGWLASPAAAQSRLSRIEASGTLSVCIWPAYYAISWRNPRNGQLEGIDIDLSQALAADLKVAVRYVESSFATFMDDLDRDACDIAMFGIGITPQRQERVAFTQPHLASSILAITQRTNRRLRTWADIDQPGVVVAVAAGTFMEPAMRESLKQASLLVVQPPATREAEVEAGRADVFMTDFPYTRRVFAFHDWARLIEPPAPFYLTRYGYAVRKGDAEWLARVDSFVTAIKRDGRLMTAATRFGLDPIVVR